MKISLNIIKKYIDFELPEADQLVEVIGSRLGALEEPPINLSEVYKDVLIVRVEEVSPVSGSDHLNLCKINDNKSRKDVERGEDGLISVVCGAPNVKPGMLAAWLPPGSVVPNTFNKEPIVLEARTLKGQVSNGMLASPKELAINDDHSGLLEIAEGPRPGDSLASLYQLDDYIIDIENKMFTHRPDCFGQLGVAREISGILGHKFRSPEWYLNSPEIESGNSRDLSVRNELPELVPRFSAIAISNIKIEPSPLLIQSYLSRLGVRPINNIIDLTNIVMLETGQPLHAYDYDKLKTLSGGEPLIVIRSPKEGETLKLLNGKEIKPPKQSIAITAGDQIIGLAGVMGGANSEIDDSTTSIVLESASFDMYSIRRTSMEVGVFSEAASRFTKGQSPLQTVTVLKYAISRLHELLEEAAISSPLIDDNHLEPSVLSRSSINPPVTLEKTYVNQLLGTVVAAEQMASTLRNVEFDVELSDQSLVVKAPFWRTDIAAAEDVVEEIGRLSGFENISPRALTRPMVAEPKNKETEVKADLRRLLASAGANELLSYSFISRRLIESAGQSTEAAYSLSNSLSPELEYYRLSLTPSLLAKVQPNIKAGFTDFALFELGSYHLKNMISENEPNIPAEYPSLAVVYAAKNSQDGAAYFRAKAILGYLLKEFNIRNISFTPLNKVSHLEEKFIELVKPFNKDRSALIVSKEKQWGIVGEYSPAIVSRLKLPQYSAGLELDSRLFLTERQTKIYRSASKFPAVKQDITLSVPTSLSFEEINSLLVSQLNELKTGSMSFEFNLTNIFNPEKEDHKNYTYRLEITDQTRTLKDQEVNELLDKLADKAKEKISARRV